jgi:hypothetical protein
MACSAFEAHSLLSRTKYILFTEILWDAEDDCLTACV